MGMPEWLYWRMVDWMGMRRYEALYAEMQANLRWESVRDAYTSILRISFEDVARIEARVLSVSAGRDDDLRSAARMGRVLREGRAVVVRGAVHAWDLQFPELFARGILAWVRGEELPGEFEPLASGAGIKRRLAAMSLAKELEDKVLIVSISPSLPRTRLEAPGAHRRVDTLIHRLRFMSDLENKLVVFDQAPASEPCECHRLRQKHCNCREKAKCTCPDLKCDTCRALAGTRTHTPLPSLSFPTPTRASTRHPQLTLGPGVDATKCAKELAALYASLTTRLQAASTAFLTLPALHADFARDTRQPSAIFRRI
ncbi:hypothetical protein VUR80DRAFT_7606 [Thermomyces stellatus]